ncbi:hypothetical protein [Paludisphaera rhizosphaerae]|uniref:hypothetical protein n=1 Tax=Paludisphaera rhizosphaerae TaxID=2711216 RepID=UPI0013EB1A07|nr:hypothetical protein [Paludisphaera rhizosphaerae]
MARGRKIRLGLVGAAAAAVAIGVGSQFAGRTGLVAGSAVSRTSPPSVPSTGPPTTDDAAAKRVDPALASPGAELIDALDECVQE